MVSIKKIATLIHRRMCSNCEVDRCGWHHETWDNPGYTRKDYTDRAQILLDTGIDSEAIITILEKL